MWRTPCFSSPSESPMKYRQGPWGRTFSGPGDLSRRLRVTSASCRPAYEPALSPKSVRKSNHFLHKGVSLPAEMIQNGHILVAARRRAGDAWGWAPGRRGAPEHAYVSVSFLRRWLG